MLRKKSLPVWTGAILFASAAALAAAGPTSKATASISVVDDLGQRVTVSAPAKRIVVIEPSNAEIALDLGLKKDLVGADSSVFQYLPNPWLKKVHGVHSIGASFPAVSEEAIVRVHPDLVISGTGVGGLNGLRKFHIPILYLDPTSIRGVYHDMLLVGKVTGTLGKAKTLVDHLKSETQAIHKKVMAETSHRPSVFLDLGGLYSAGPKSFINSLIRLAGATNVVDSFSQKAYPEVTAEQVVRADPDIIVVDPEGTSVAKEEALAGFSSIRAVIHHRVYALPQPSYIEQPSPGLVLGLKELVRIFHPGIKF